MRGGARDRARYVIALVLALPATGRADAPVYTDATWHYASTGSLALDGGFVFGAPAALPTGLARGGTIGAIHTIGGRTFGIGGRVSYATASESTAVWQVTHRDVDLRLEGSIRHAIGRGLVGLRLGAGATYVHESRLLQQGMRAGLVGDALHTTANALLPAANLDAVVGVYVTGPWRVQLAGGPAISIDGGAQLGWTAGVGLAWQP